VRNIKLIILSILVGIISPVFASKEIFYINPAIGSFSSDKKFLKYIKRYQEIYVYNNKLVYSPSFKLLENKYLILKAIELGQMNNEQFINKINGIDEGYKKFDNIMKKWSIEEKIKKIFRSSAILGFTTDAFSKELTTVGFATHALKQVLEDEYIKSMLIKEVSYITESNYDFWTTLIISGTEFTLALYEDISFENITTKKGFINVFSKSFSKFVGVPLSLYETGLKSANIGATIGAIFSLNNAKNIAMPNRLASSFLYDYVNLFQGDINAMSTYIEDNYKYWNVGNATIQGDIRIYKKTSKWGQEIKNRSFFDVFYWYTLISEHNNKNLEIATFKREDLANIVRGARKALDYIENYGNGGNFKFKLQYKMGTRKSKGKEYPYKYLEFITESNAINFLYFMPKNFDNDSKKIDKYFYNFTHLPQLSLPKQIKSVSRINAKAINKYVNIKIFQDKQIKNSKEFISLQLYPVITIKYNKTIESKKLNDFYIKYGYSTLGINPNNINYGQKVFTDIYNLGLLNTFNKGFNPKEPATSDLITKVMYGYVDKIYAYSNKDNFYWSICKKNLKCSSVIKYKLEPITRANFAKMIVDKYNLIGYKPLRPFKRKGTDWTEEGKILYKLEIMSGDNSTEKMNADFYVSNIELLIMMKRLKTLIIRKGKK